MTITAIRTLCATRLHERADQWITDRYRSIKADAAIVVVETDEGIFGVGEACAYGNPRQIADWVAWLAPNLVGADLDDHSVVPHPTGSAFAGVSAHDYAVAGLDCALWDARGRRAGVPTRTLLGPDSDSEVPVYASSGVRYDWAGRSDDLVDDVLACAADGYETVKVRIGTSWGWDGVTPGRFLMLLDRAREAAGPDLTLAVDANSRLTRDEALEVARGLADRGVAWFEEPIDKRDLDGYVWLNRQVPDLRISGGESFTTAEQFRPFLEAGGYDVVQPDAGVCGISEVLRIGRLAERHGVELLPHGWHNGLMLAANAHAVAALPNAAMIEECMVQGPLRWGIVEGGTQVHKGKIRLDAPGLGVDLVDDLEERFPYVEGHYSVEVYR